MYTPTSTKNKQRSISDEDDIVYDKKFYSFPKFNKTEKSKKSDSLSQPVMTMTELLTENELQLAIDTDTDDKFKTAKESLHKTTYATAASTSSTESPLVEEQSTFPTSTSFDQTSSINSRNRIFLVEHPDDLRFKDIQLLRGKTQDLFSTIEETVEEESIDTSPSVINESTPNELPLSTDTLIDSTNIPTTKDSDYQPITPSLLHIMDTMDLSSEKILNGTCTSKDDLSAKSDSINMLSVVISTVMLLASKSQIPQNYVTWTLKYLKCIKNKQGQHPPNIKKIQKMLTSPSTSGSGQWQATDFLTGKNPGKRLDLTKKRKS